MVDQMFSGIFLVLSYVLLNAQTQVQEGGKKRSPEPLERIDRKPQSRKGSRNTDQALRGGTAINGPIDLIWVEAGSFVMGSPESEANRRKNEVQHSVQLTRGFYLGRFEVTRDQWATVMERRSINRKDASLPVGGVSWNDAIQFCERLTEIEKKKGRLPSGMSYQLPTEAEWEYACRAGTTTTYFWGDDPNADRANFGKEFGSEGVEPVGKYPPNAWGFHDMHGNVYEWCNDTATCVENPEEDHLEKPYPAKSVIDPQGHLGDSVSYQLDTTTGRYVKLKLTTPSKIMRGGCYWSRAGNVRSAYRHSHPATDTIDFKGFRVALKYDD